MLAEDSSDIDMLDMLLNEEEFFSFDSIDELLAELPRPRHRSVSAYNTVEDRENSVFWRRYIKPALDAEDAEIRDPTSREGEIFRRRFRVPYETFEWLVEDIKRVHSLPDFRRGASGLMGVHIKLLVLGSLRLVTSGCPLDLIQELTNVSIECHRRFFHEKFSVWGQRVRDQYISMPHDSASLDRVQASYEGYGLPGAAGSVDCVHVVWDCCPASMQSSCLGKDKVPTLVFEMVGDHSRRIMSVSQYFWGTFNDRSISRLDPVFDLFRDDGAFLKNVKWHSFRADGTLREHRGAYLICDGGYNDWRCTVCPYKVSSTILICCVLN